MAQMWIFAGGDLPYRIVAKFRQNRAYAVKLGSR
jgi:hypothetical protein